MKIMAILYEKTIGEVIADLKLHLSTNVQCKTYDTYDMIRLNSVMKFQNFIFKPQLSFLRKESEKILLR